MPHVANHPVAALGLLWPAFLAEEVSEFSGALARGLSHLACDLPETTATKEPCWITPNEIVFGLESVLLRRFGQPGKGQPILICAPFALHAPTITDLAPGHSLIEALQAATEATVYVADWRSASPDRSSHGIDDYLADLNVVVDEIGGAIDLVGLCQGGWMGLAYAARFPRKVRKLVLAGAPIDIAAADSELSRLAHSIPIGMFKHLVALGGGLMLGGRFFQFWQPRSLDLAAIRSTLQIDDSVDTDAFREVEARFREWYAWTLDLPGRFYLESVERIYLKNELATGRFMALGQRVDLASVRMPIFLLAARDDQVVVPAQTLAVQDLIGTPRVAIRSAVAAGEHLGLFMGQQTLASQWGDIGRWLREASSAPGPYDGGSLRP
jgi:poly(3-hydroxyalkanoate) synthetase